MSVYWDEPLETALQVLAEGIVTLDELQAANIARRQGRPAIGQLALTQRKLTVAQVFRILEQQALTGQLFGQIAVQMGFLETGDLYELLRVQANFTPSLSDVLETRGAITQEQAAAIRESIRERLRATPESVVHAIR